MSVLVVYWSGSGNTEIIAEKVKEGIEKAGLEVTLAHVSQIDPSDALEFDKIAMGCPAMGGEDLEEFEFQPFFDAIVDELGGKKIALFGSYDWGDAEWMRNWESRVEEAGATLVDKGLAINLTPDEDGEEEAIKLGEKLANA